MVTKHFSQTNFNNFNIVGFLKLLTGVFVDACCIITRVSYEFLYHWYTITGLPFMPKNGGFVSFRQFSEPSSSKVTCNEFLVLNLAK